MHMQYPYDNNVLKSVMPLLQYALKNYPLWKYAKNWEKVDQCTSNKIQIALVSAIFTHFKTNKAEISYMYLHF